MEKVLLTGADGFLGSNIARELINRGYHVIALVEARREPHTLRGLENLTILRGDILDPDSLLAAFEGCGKVIHAAANTNLWPPRSAMYRRVNYDGTLNVVDAALRSGIDKMVYIGTANTFGYGTKESPGDETRPYNCAKFGLDYLDSKKAAFDKVLEAVHTLQLPATIVNPCFMFGPYDNKPSSGAMIVSLVKGKVPGYTAGGRNFLFVGDAAAGVVNALERGQKGEAYILGNQNLSYGEIFTLIANTLGVRRPWLPIPSFMAKTYGAVGSLSGMFTKKAPTVTFEMAVMSSEGNYYSAAKAIRELGLPQTSLEKAILKAHEWLKQYGLLN